MLLVLLVLLFGSVMNMVSLFNMYPFSFNKAYQSSAEVKNVWRYTSLSQYAFKVWCSMLN